MLKSVGGDVLWTLAALTKGLAEQPHFAGPTRTEAANPPVEHPLSEHRDAS